MDPNANPSDSVADVPESSPSGIGPVEESVGANPVTANVERPEEAAAPEEVPPPHAVHFAEGEWIQLPEELNADFAELFGLLRARPVEGNANEAYNDEALRALNGDADDGMPVNVQDLVAQLDVIAPTGPHQYHHVGLPPLAQVLQSITPQQDRLVLQTFFDAAHQIITELTDNPQQRAYSLQETESRVGNFEEIRRVIENLDSDTAELINTFVAETEDELVHLITTPARIEMARQEVRALLDSHINARIAALPLDSTQTDSPSCAICLEEYVESDLTVSLQCHHSHHFHRDCILDWLESLVPEQLTCPICRAEVELSAPPDPDPLD
ncbi:hypothetical protein MJO28_002246 [Puccinia striiformis f. sp. tritici]|uniref:RING-type domain-containing protein n=2 Tax=Puccinia striiformis TaxID=27350 RepID=A0A2S4UL33_9BASI|nr:hypothetical protein Pst134EA_002532 [Puccinia striiformis f. sp. tritici]POV97834.1 hypothetical protein PSHT_14356 [Puccinia striiformis]KAH9464121.1 hypothetical protein Pst134EB_003656 [Puccinia striiformis f. sp. tritici]KAH9471901.1 hypothetical protein Pst134EA_002532 [Puccinia striiformis f. sp. tritici]KAI7961757.1 hypothetical protein MJO28_002246 [Puccinia striiformis f. sp. tritici]KAI7966580.1 hypothetical protein MJO29_002328 [Puccinia striiformis f. sp. tritici]